MHSYQLPSVLLKVVEKVVMAQKRLMHILPSCFQQFSFGLSLQHFVGPYQAEKMSRRGLMEQDLAKLDVTKLHPLSPEVISRQATINIGILPL